MASAQPRAEPGRRVARARRASGSASGLSQTRFRPSMPSAGDHGVAEAPAQLVLAHLHVEAQQPLEDPLGRRAAAAAALHRLAQALVAGHQARARPRPSRAPSSPRSPPSSPAGGSSAALRSGLDQRGQAALAERSRPAWRVRQRAAGRPRRAALDPHLHRVQVLADQAADRCSRSQGTPLNWTHVRDLVRATQPTKLSRSTSSSATALSRFGADEQQPRRHVGRRAATARTGPARALDDVAHHQARLGRERRVGAQPQRAGQRAREGEAARRAARPPARAVATASRG